VTRRRGRDRSAPGAALKPICYVRALSPAKKKNAEVKLHNPIIVRQSDKLHWQSTSKGTATAELVFG
jgi:hypothetical protein